MLTTSAAAASASSSIAGEPAFWMAIVRDTISEATGQQHTFTASGQTATPRAALFLRNFTAVDATMTDRGSLNIGAMAYNGVSTAQWAASHMMHHSSPGSNNGCEQSATQCAGLGRYSAGWLKQKSLAIASRGSGSITCDIASDEAFTETPLVTCVMFGGTALRCAAGSGAIPLTTGGTINVTCTDDVGDFVPDLLFIGTTGRGTVSTYGLPSFGIGVKNGSNYDQACNGNAFSSDGSNYLIGRMFRNNVIMSLPLNNGTAEDGNWTATVNGTSGFTLTKNAGGNTNAGGNFGWLALKGLNAKLLSFTMPTVATPNVDIDAGAAFAPLGALLIASMMQNVNTIADDLTPDSYSLAISAIMADQQQCTAVASRKLRDNVHNAQSLSDNRALNLPAFDGSNYIDGYLATFDSFPSNGVIRLDFDTVNASSIARQAFVVLLG